MVALNEAEEAFGVPPVRRTDDLAMHILAVGSSDDPVEQMQDCLRLAEEVQGDAYTAALTAYLNASESYGGFDEQKAFFHAAAEFGEARMLARVLDVLLTKCAIGLETVGNA